MTAPPGPSGDTHTALAQAREVFDLTFSHYYNQLHQQHGADLEQATAMAHRIQFWTNALFFVQLGLAVLFGVFGLFYLEWIARVFRSAAERMAITDGLTGAFNRRYLDTALAEELGRARRHGNALSIAMIDIDHFKRFNDTHGHQAGDVLLQALVRQVREHTRAEDYCARYGGEEFVVTLPQTALDAGIRVAEKLRRVIAGQAADVAGGTPVTVSIGVAAFPADGDDAALLIRIADERLYQAKAAGRNQVVPAAKEATGFPPSS